MTRRAQLPGASELFFRSTSPATTNGDTPALEAAKVVEAPHRGSPRTKHDTKITVYLSEQELLAMEHARLVLRATHDLTVDRGRIVREAVAVLLRDLEDNGADAVLVRRLRADENDGERTNAEPVG